MEREERALCARQFGVIDMNHYRQHGRGRKTASHGFISGHLYRQKLGRTHSEHELNVSMYVREREFKCVRVGESRIQGQSISTGT